MPTKRNVPAAASPEGRYSVREAAALANLTPSMVRWLDREGLVHPQRTPGGHRVFTTQDLDRLRHIGFLRRVERLNAAAIRRELGPPEPADSSAARTPEVDATLGRRLRSLRSSRKLSLAEIAARTNLSISFLSAVERGQSGISLANLIKLADAFDTSVPGLRARARKGQRYLIRAGDQPSYAANQGRVRIESLIVQPGTLQVVRYVVEPGGESEDAYSHTGLDFIHIISGSLTFWIEEAERYDLRAGDSLWFPSHRLHRWKNQGTAVAMLLWINTPLESDSVPRTE
jgi:DNA-binding transcriptional MerR regulator/quercetin dioxygenase-like cupin family protein